MKQIRKSASIMLGIVTTGIIIVACSKGGDTPAPNPPAGNACATKNITVSAGTTNAAGCTGGTITATASGSTNFTYNIDGGAFQTSGTFNNVTAGRSYHHRKRWRRLYQICNCSSYSERQRPFVCSSKSCTRCKLQ